MRLAQVAAGEGASAANRLQQPDPQLGQIALGRWRSRGGWLLGNDSGRGRGEARRFILFEYNSPRRSLGARRRRGRGGAPRRITGLSVAQTLELLEQSIDAHRTARFDGFEQGHLNQYLLGCRVPHAHLRLGQNLHDARKPFGAGHRRLLLERSGFGLGYLSMVRSPFDTWKMSRLRKWFSRSDNSRPRSLPWLARSFNWRRAVSTSPASTAWVRVSSWPCAVRPNIEIGRASW